MPWALREWGGGALAGTGPRVLLWGLHPASPPSCRSTAQQPRALLAPQMPPRYAINTDIEHEYAGPIANLSLWYNLDKGLKGGDKFVVGGESRRASDQVGMHSWLAVTRAPGQAFASLLA